MPDAALTVFRPGISFKTQALYVVVFCTRYLDLLTFDFVSFYNVMMKLFFIGSSVYILYLMRLRFRSAARALPRVCLSAYAFQANARPVH